MRWGAQRQPDSSVLIENLKWLPFCQNAERKKLSRPKSCRVPAVVDMRLGDSATAVLSRLSVLVLVLVLVLIVFTV